MTIEAITDTRADTDAVKAVLRKEVDRALGRFAGRSTITVEEFGELMHISRASAYEAIKRGDCPSIRLGERRVVIGVPSVVALLLGQPNGERNAEGAAPNNATPSLADAHQVPADERTSPA
jgi:hypothetical protein